MNFDTDLPAKRTRRSTASSPSLAEGQASRPESTAIMSEVSTSVAQLISVFIKILIVLFILLI